MSKKMLLGLCFSFIFFQSFHLNAAYTAADLPVVDEKIYHLSMRPDDMAPNIIVVGDPERVPFVARFCLQSPYKFEGNHRGLHVITGETKSGVPVSIVTSGMGTPSTEIVINELVALNEIDLVSRTRRSTPLYPKMNIIRLGTSGGLQESTALGTPIISAYAVGLDNTGLFYDAPVTSPEIPLIEKACQEAIEAGVPDCARFAHKIHPYAASASPDVVRALCASAHNAGVDVKIGITASNAGFFANQGRDVSRVRLTVPDLDGILSKITFDGLDLKIENMEMEASFMFLFFGALGDIYHVGAVCLAIANRRLNTFDSHSERHMLDALFVILGAFERLHELAIED